MKSASPDRGNLLIWLSGAQPQVLAGCPADRPKYTGMGAAIAITAAVAAVSVTFALHSALKTPLPLAVPLAAAWGLAVMSLDRWLVASLARQESKRAYLRLALPRLALALLFGVIISTPVVLQVFRPEIMAEIPVLQQQQTAAGYRQAAGDAAGAQIARDRRQIATLEAAIRSGGLAGEGVQQDPQVKALRIQRNQVTHRARLDFQRWHATADPQMRKAYLADTALRARYIAQISAREAQIRQDAAGASAHARVQLPAAQARLRTDTARQAQFLASLSTNTSHDTGLLIQLQALDALARRSSTVWWARLLLVAFFTAIECLPVLVKLLLNLGPPTRYEVALGREEEAQAAIGDHRRRLRTYQALADGERTGLGARRILAAVNSMRFTPDAGTVAAVDRVAAAQVAAWEAEGTAGLPMPPADPIPAEAAWGGSPDEPVPAEATWPADPDGWERQYRTEVRLPLTAPMRSQITQRGERNPS